MSIYQARLMTYHCACKWDAGEDVRLEEALRRMQRTRQRMAVVIGFDGRDLGIVSLRDILKSIFGEVTL